MKIVFDSNVYIAAFATHGVCHLLVEACLVDHSVYSSDFILREVEEKLERKIKLPRRIVDEVIAYLHEQTTNYNPGIAHTRISRDPDDDNILRLAEETFSEYIVTGDKDLLVLGSHLKTKIVSPRDFADILHSLEA